MMALEPETVETLEAAAVQLTPPNRGRLANRLLATLDTARKWKKLGQQKWSAGKTKSKMERFLYYLVQKLS